MTSGAAVRPGPRPASRPLLPPAIWPAVGSRLQIVVGPALALPYLAALGAGQDQIALMVIAMSAVVSVAWPAAGLAMFVMIMPMREPEILVPIRINAIMAGAIAMGCILRLPVDRLRLRVHPGVVMLVGYVVISALSLPSPLNGLAPAWLPSAMNALIRFSTGVALFLSAAYLFRLMSPWPILALAMLGTGLTALLAIGDITSYLPFTAFTGGLVENTGSARASGAFADPNFLGLYAATAFTFGLGVLAAARRSLKLALLPLVLLLLACVALSYSRGAYVGVATGAVVLVWLRHRAAAVVLLVVIGILGVTLYPAFLEARQGGALIPVDSYDLAQSEASRRAMVLAGVAMFLAHPIVGVGFGVFQYVSPFFIKGAAPDSTFSHNQYLNILAEQGLVGALLVGALVVIAAVAIRRSGSPLAPATQAMGAALHGTSAFLHSGTVFQSLSLLWLVLAVTLATGSRRGHPSKEG